MKKLFTIVAGLAVVYAALGLLLQGVVARAQEEPALTPNDGENIHIFPTVERAAALAALGADPGPLLYHSGGVVMTGSVTTYAIFWLPASGKLQNGGATSLSAHYQTVQKNMLGDYPAHGIDNNNTQYYQKVGTTTTYLQNKGVLGGAYLDTSAYPASGCMDSATPGNCITDAQIQTEIKNVMAFKGWTGGINKMFLLFTSSGEGSCTTFGCAYTDYCAYHGFISGSPPIIYGNEPYGDPSFCQVPGTPSPNSDAAADTAATAASHELTEATTDPELNAWYTSLGNEIGDLCAYNYGTNTWDSAKANQMWNGRFYELQQEFDNHLLGCVQVGP